MVADRTGKIGPALQISQRSEITSFIAMDVLARANQIERDGASVIHMEVGQPSTPAPRCVIEAAQVALREERLGYTEALGIPQLREKIAEHYLKTYGVFVDPSRIVVTTGSSAGFILSFLAILNQGEKVALASPGYPCYRHILTALGNEVEIIETDAASRWAPRVEDFEAAFEVGDLKALLIASPANPTGTMLTPDRLKGLIHAAETRGVWFVSDEIYHGLTFENPGRTALEFSDNVIVINSFSKYFSMTGWRIGWMVVPEMLVRSIEKLQQNLFISSPTLSQIAAVSAFDAHEELEGHRAVYQRNRDVLIEQLSSAGLADIAPADGAFYLYGDVSKFTSDSLQFARRMLEETGVAATPGLDFDEARGANYIRFSYAGNFQDMEMASNRLARWLSAQ